MLLVHQAGSVKVGEVVRYTLTYTPSNDRILPTPKHLHVKVKNTSAIPLRAAWVRGPYALHVSAYPATFNPHHKVENPKKDGVPEYEPMLKAGGSWSTKLLVPDAIRETGADLGRRRSYQQGPEHGDQEEGRMTWIIEIASQILFSNSASVGFEVLVGRDERSLELGFAAVAGAGHGAPAHIKELQGEKERKEARKRDHVQHEGVYSKAVRLVVEDTETLWDKPPLPSWDNEDDKEKKRRKSLSIRRKSEDVKDKDGKHEKDEKPKKRRNVHLVILTHGLHSNLGADMLFLKESIDATVAQARADAKKRKEQYRASQGKTTDTSGADDVKAQQEGQETATAPLTGGQDDLNNAPEEDDDEEEIIVRGFHGNAVKTENGIQYLGKRLAKYILRFTYPDQPFLPIHRNLTRKFTDTFTSEADKAKRDGKPAHQGSSVAAPREARKADELPYKFTSISFIGHSLGGLVQTYAVAYIHKHSPTFFQQIQPVNFVCLASPMLGLSNENPMYVKFALDFGLVGRTGQDLGLTWRAPTLANKGWNAMGSIFANSSAQKDKEHDQPDAAAKPLLRILPTGPAHQVLRMFRNRTVYSNVINDGIVPLRTSCLLFLDWKGLGKVEKARRENGLIGTVAEWGWAELTGANSTALLPSIRAEKPWESEDDSSPVRDGQGDSVPQPSENETAEDNKRLSNRMSFNEEDGGGSGASRGSDVGVPAQSENQGMLSTVMGWFGTNTSAKPAAQPRKTSKILRRGQTMNFSADTSREDVSQDPTATTTNPTMRPHLHSDAPQHRRPAATRGDSSTNLDSGEVMAPPKTSIFESAGDILHPPLPSRQWICDPSTRARTIFHDRVYHPEDIPPPPTKKDKSNSRQTSISSRDGTTNASTTSQKSSDTTITAQSNAAAATVTNTSAGTSGMKVEEKIARAYHRDISWRKVLVRLEPDAHNNIIVRRMFANAYGWPVVKHLCDTHFADTHAAKTRDEDEPARERAKPLDAPISGEHGEQVEDQTSKQGQVKPRTKSETREARDELADLAVPQDGMIRSNSATRRSLLSSSYSSTGSGNSLSRKESAVWDDAFFDGSDGEESDAVDERNLVAKILNPNLALKKPEPAHHRQQFPQQSHSTSTRSPPQPIQTYTDGHRGLAPYSPGSPNSPQAAHSPTNSRRRTSAEVKQARPTQAAAKPTFDAADAGTPIVLSDNLVEEPTPITPTSPIAGSVGLGKSVEEQISPSLTANSKSGKSQHGRRRGTFTADERGGNGDVD